MNELQRIVPGAEVRIHYSLTVDGEVLDSTRESEPVRYTQGRRMLVPGLEERLEGLRVSERVRIVVPPERAYGPYRPENVHEMSRSIFTDPDSIKVGMMVEGRTRLGAPFQAKVLKIGEDAFLIDLNHPLAGKYLEFDVEIVAVVPSDAPPISGAPEDPGSSDPWA